MGIHNFDESHTQQKLTNIQVIVKNKTIVLTRNCKTHNIESMGIYGQLLADLRSGHRSLYLKETHKLPWVSDIQNRPSKGWNT